MGLMSTIRAAISLLILGLLLSGCAGTARGIKSSVYQPDEAATVKDVSRSQADAMVVIRYPAVVSDDAMPAYYRSFEQHAIGGKLELDSRTRQDTDRVAQSIITKSNYYAMSLYREFRDKLPSQSVLLSPHIITLDDEDKLTSLPLLASEQVPSVVTIDFNIYSFPDPRKMMDSEPLTFGDIVTPLFVVHSGRGVEPVGAPGGQTGGGAAGRYDLRVPPAAGFRFFPAPRQRERGGCALEKRRPIAPRGGCC